jgi:hypothetical protein
MDELDPKMRELLAKIQESKNQLDLQKLNEAYARSNQPYTEDINMIDKVSPSLQEQSKLFGTSDTGDILKQMNDDELKNKEIQQNSIPRFSRLLGK